MSLSIQDVQNAAERIEPYIHHTPVLTSSALNQITHATLFFKCENFQKIGAFKFRGACNAIFSLSDAEAQKGVATHSSGNHAAAVALAAKMRGIPAYIVMPTNSPQVKKDAVAGYGGQITFCEPGTKNREIALEKVLEKTGAVFIHPYNNERVIAGQGTAAMELLDQVNNLDIVIAPIGGGGLISGTSIAVKAHSPHTQVIGAEPEMANDAYISFKTKTLTPIENPQTICDGLSTSSIGPIPFPIILENVSDIFTASEATIMKAMRLVWERMKIVIEPSAAVALAIILEHPNLFKNKRIGLILSGGNADIKALAPLL